MAAMTLAQLAPVLRSPCRGDARVAGVSTDTRTLQPGELFVALQGEHYDGNKFLAQAASAGAVAAIVGTDGETALPHIRVDDTRQAYGLIARCNRRASDACVVALTGSAGKTTCKEMLAAILGNRAPTLATRGNLNNEIGVPQTLLQLAPEHRYAVIEMGAGKAGDITYLCQFAEPDVALVTSVMPVHLEGFGSVEAIAQTKGGIYAGLSAQGIAVIDADSPYADLWRSLAGSRRVMSFSRRDKTADCFAGDIAADAEGAISFTLSYRHQSVPVRLALLGHHNVGNALAAATAALAAGASLLDVQQGLAAVRPVPGRLCLTRRDDGVTVIDDCYNANPGAVKAAIDVLKERPGRRCLVLGTMGELGPTAAALHREVGAYACANGIDKVLAVGEFAADVAAGFGAGARVFADMAALQLAAPDVFQGFDVLLVKGSRSARMERVVAILLGSSSGDHH